MQIIEVEYTSTYIIRKANGQVERLGVLPGNRIHLPDRAVVIAVIPNIAKNMMLE